MKPGLLAALVLISACSQELLPGNAGFDPDSGFSFDIGPDGGGAGLCGGSLETDAPVATVSPPPISGGSMTALSDGTVVVGDVDRDLLWLVTGDADSIRKVDLPAGAEPGRIVAGPAGTAYVVLRRANQIASLDVAAGTVSLLETCSLPRGLTYQAQTGALFVGCADGTIVKYLGGHRSELVLDSKISDLRDLVDEGDHFIATSFRSARVFSIAADTGVTTELPYAGVPTDGVPRVAWRSVGTPGGTLVSYQTQRTTTLPPLTQTCGAYGEASGTMPSLVVSTVGLVSGGAVRQQVMMPQGVLPVDVATNTLGEWVVVTAASSSVQTSWAPGAEAPGDAGLQPFAFNPLFMSGQPVAVVARGEQWVVFEREPAAIAFFTRQSFFPNEVPLPGASMESTGHRLFHQATFANIACASCHPEAGDDEHVWQFSEGARRTPTLRGGLAATAPFHWSGDEASMSSLVADVMVRRMSGNAQTPARAEALLGWLDRQPRMDPPPTDAASVARGQALFASADAQCASCHTGPLGTNNATLDVHTGGSFQVPRLAELGWRTQWFHDGRIATPADRFGPAGGGDAHGHTSQLSAAERADLLEYLKSR